MKFIPKLFSTSMVQAIMKGNKTQTRRTDGLKSVNVPFIEGAFTGWQYDPTIAKLDKKGEIIPQECIGRYAEFDMGEWLVKCPYEVGDVIWVRETFQQQCIETDTDENWAAKAFESTGQYVYKADNYQLPKDSVAFGKWKPGIHMPKSACRLFLEIKSVNVERLQLISDKDCIAEGIDPNKTDSEDINDCGFTLYFRFKSLWQSINGPESWDLNPYVWVIEFEKIDKPENFL